MLYYLCYPLNRVLLYIKSSSLSAIDWRITGGIVEFPGDYYPVNGGLLADY